MVRVIAQLFNIKLKNIIEYFPQLSELGVTHVQISPVQQHCRHIKKWYRVYQPSGVSIGNSLGSQEELVTLVNKAKCHGISIIVDVVFHHKTGCLLCNPTYRNISWWKKVISRYCGFQLGGVDSRFNCNDFGPKEELEAKTVIDNHIRFLTNLISIGVQGFRFDAAKHIPPEYFKFLMNRCNLTDRHDLIMYGEVLDGGVEICSSYIVADLQVTDFPLTFSVIEALKWGKDIRSLATAPCLKYERAICLADCHDSKVGNSYSFPSEQDSILGICFLLARGQGTPLIYHTLIEEKHVKSGIKFFRLTFGKSIEYRLDFSTETMLIIQRGDIGFSILNKSNNWVDIPSLKLPFIQLGSYKELVYNFNIEIELGGDNYPWVSRWNNKNRGGVEIGPRDILYFIKESNL